MRGGKREKKTERKAITDGLKDSDRQLHRQWQKKVKERKKMTVTEREKVTERKKESDREKERR